MQSSEMKFFLGLWGRVDLDKVTDVSKAHKLISSIEHENGRFEEFQSLLN